MEDIIFELKDVHFSYLNKFPALCGLDLVIKKGEMVSVIGANGCGKSTLLHILDGLIFPDRGNVSAFGKDLSESNLSDEDCAKDFRRKVGFVFQNPEVQLFCPTVKEDIIFGPLQLGIEKAVVKKRLDDLVNLLHIQELIERSPHQLSIGEKRKVAIATTLAIDPEVIILDEPTAGLDPLTTRQIIDLLVEANANGKTIITATHDLHILEEIADVVHVFNRQKRIARSASASELLCDADFLRENNLIHIHRHRHQDKAHIHPHEHMEHHHEK